MEWKNFPTLFYTGTETVADLSNQALCERTPLRPHNLDGREAAVISSTSPRLDPTLATLSREPLLIRNNAQLLVYVEVFVDDLLGMSQGPTHRHRYVRCTLFHVSEKVFRPLDK